MCPITPLNTPRSFDIRNAGKGKRCGAHCNLSERHPASVTPDTGGALLPLSHDVGRADARYLPSLEMLAAESDMVSVHVPGGPATHHRVDASLLARIKPSAILINTARGSVFDEAALAAALRSGVIAGAGLDMFEREPAIHSDLLACENAVLLPHLGSATIETRMAMGIQMSDNLDVWYAGDEPPNRIA